jgi:hypothetical protein
MDLLTTRVGIKVLNNGRGIGTCQNCFVAAVFTVADLDLKPCP